jgi:hypothetical protein
MGRTMEVPDLTASEAVFLLEVSRGMLVDLNGLVVGWLEGGWRGLLGLIGRVFN